MVPALLPLDGQSAYVLLDACVAFANQCEADGDESTAQIADEYAARLRRLLPLLTQDADQQLRSMGLGRYKGRPQG